MKLAIVGGRTFNDYSLLEKTFYNHFTKHGISEIVIISGGAKGADSLAFQFAENHRLEMRVYPAEWDKFGKSAGFIRNQTIVDNCDMVLVFWDGVSRGTADTIEKAKRAKKPTFIIYF